MKTYRIQEVKLRLVRSNRPTFQANSPQQVATAFAGLAQEVRESLYAIYLSNARDVLAVERVSTGSISRSFADPAEVLRSALLIGARALILLHNHVSGSPIPSEADRAITTDIATAAKLFSIEILDHVIIGHNGAYFSFKDQGLIPAATPD